MVDGYLDSEVTGELTKWVVGSTQVEWVLPGLLALALRARLLFIRWVVAVTRARGRVPT